MDHPEKPIDLSYYPDVFETPDMKSAKEIILTAEKEASTQERWEKETPFLAELIGRSLPPLPSVRVLDYGCGIGRISKELIEKHGCSCLGVDISQSMRRFAPQYVASKNFSATSPTKLSLLVERGFRVDFAVSIWVLQHCSTPQADIALIKSVLKKNGLFFVVNNKDRCIPALDSEQQPGWLNDSVDVLGLLREAFQEVETLAFTPTATTPEIIATTYIKLFQNTG
ncbi:MAG: class I SAM-dependent methyltransferase [Magnetococcales bacterium]|nr:class I SAM-dependent methyltransferase [Magnetococcales bacterium]